MGTALLIVFEIVVWGICVVLIGAFFETTWARFRRRKKHTVL